MVIIIICFQRTKTDPSKHFSKSQSELQNTSRPSISDPFCPQRMYIMDTDKKPEEVQVCKNNRGLTEESHLGYWGL